MEGFYNLLKERYLESDSYYANICSRFAKIFRLYDSVGVFKIGDKICGNTILDACFIPDFELSKVSGEKVKSMAAVAGKYISLFDATKELNIKTQCFSTIDIGGFHKIPFGRTFSIDYVLFSLLGEINFVLNGVETLVIGDVSTKLRIEYICYFHLAKILEQIKTEYKIDVTMSKQLYSRQFRNAMAHYKLGIALNEDELITDDPMKGLAQKFFDCDFYTVKSAICEELLETTNKIEKIICV